MPIPQHTTLKLVLATLLCAGALVARAAPPKTQTYYALSDTVFIYPQAEMHVTEIVIAQGEKNCQMALAELQLSHVPKPRAPTRSSTAR